MPLKETPISNKEHDFVLGAIAKSIRLDKRKIHDYRPLSITFGLEYGYCYVSLGDTKVLAQVAAEVDRPKESRANEGRLSIHLEISTLAAGHLDPTKPSSQGVEIRQFLERSLLFSGAIDLEELCLRTGEKAWSIHLYLHVLTHDGNILDCASVAAITALRHFRRPSVQFSGREVIVQKMEEGNPVPLTINHMPFCVSFAFFEGGKYSLLDASSTEEKVMDGQFLVSMNKHRQICRLLMSGSVQINKIQITRCTNIAAMKVKDISDFVKKALEVDAERRKNGGEHTPITAQFLRKEGDKQAFGFIKDQMKNIGVVDDDDEEEEMNGGGDSEVEIVSDESEAETATANVAADEGSKTAWSSAEVAKTLGKGEVNSWFANNSKQQTEMEEGELDGSSDEEETVTLGQNDYV